jgi:hypothetical protein
VKVRPPHTFVAGKEERKSRFFRNCSLRRTPSDAHVFTRE